MVVSEIISREVLCYLFQILHDKIKKILIKVDVLPVQEDLSIIQKYKVENGDQSSNTFGRIQLITFRLLEIFDLLEQLVLSQENAQLDCLDLSMILL